MFAGNLSLKFAKRGRTSRNFAGFRGFYATFRGNGVFFAKVREYSRIFVRETRSAMREYAREFAGFYPYANFR